MTIASNPKRNQGGTEIHQGTPGTEDNMTLLKPLHGKLLLHEEERWET
jgi:hypothetical protein